MSVRTTESTVTFSESFRVADSDEILPPGTYRVVMDDEELPGTSFMAYRRVATMLMVPRIDAPAHQRRDVLTVSQTELDAALIRDRHHAL